jgi:acyl dehydratase
MNPDASIPEEIKALIGTERVYTGTERLGEGTIKRFADAIGDRNPLYWDEEFARNSRNGGITAPPTLIFELNHHIGAEIAEDGLPEEQMELHLPLGALFRGGNEYEMFQPVRPDDVITSRRKLVEIREKSGRSGTLIFVVSEIAYSNQRGELLGVNRETVIYRPERDEV